MPETPTAPAASSDSGSFWGSLLGTVKDLGTTAGQAYVAAETAKLKESSAATTATRPAPATTSGNPATTATAASTALVPWYKKSWVIPTAIGAALLLVVVFIFAGRRRR
jgi:hypothetical protein